MASRGAPASLALLLVLLLAGPPLFASEDSYQPRRTNEKEDDDGAREFFSLKIGVSLSLTPPKTPGAVPPCFWCKDARTALGFLENFVNSHYLTTLDGSGLLTISFQIEDDGHDADKCLDNYVQMAKSAKPGYYYTSVHPKIDAFLGPSYYVWNTAIARALVSKNRPVIMWSFDNAVYSTVPFTAGMSGLQVCTLDSDCPTSSQCMDNFCQMRVPTYDYNDMAKDLTWDPSWKHAFDINVNRDNWSIPALDVVLSRNFTRGDTLDNRDHFVFAWFDDLEDGSVTGKRCQDYMHYVLSVHPHAWAVALPLKQDVEQVYATAKVLKESFVDVLLFCGTSDHYLWYLKVLKAAHADVPILIVDSPVITNEYDTNYVLEPFPGSAKLDDNCSFFGSKQQFRMGYNYWTKKNLSWASMQVSAAVAQIILAVEQAPRKESSRCKFPADLAMKDYCDSLKQYFNPVSWESEFVSLQAHRWIPLYLSNTTLNTFWGTVAFAPDGQQKGLKMAARQILPVLPATTRAFTKADKIVSDDALQNCLMTVLDEDFCRASFNNNIELGLSWFFKRMEVYPCAPGCIDANFMCRSCPAGRARQANQPACLECPVGEYQDLEGTAECRLCPVGADCSVFNSLPVANPGYFRFVAESNETGSAVHSNKTFGSYVSNFTDLGVMMDDWFQCVHKHANKQPRFFQCHHEYLCIGAKDNSGRDGCLGFNAGLMCGNCRPGYSRYGRTLLYGECTKCNYAEPIIIFFLLILFLYCTVLYIDHEASISARTSGRIVCAVIRMYFHWAHMLGAIFEVCNLHGYPLFLPFEVIAQVVNSPYELVKIDCIIAQGTTSSATVGTVTAQRMVVTIGIGVLIGVQMLLYYWRVSLMFLYFLRKKLRACCKCLSRLIWGTDHMAAAEAAAMAAQAGTVAVAQAAGSTVVSVAGTVAQTGLSMDPHIALGAAQETLERKREAAQRAEAEQEMQQNTSQMQKARAAAAVGRYNKLREKNYLAQRFVTLLRKLLIWIVISQGIMARNSEIFNTCAYFRSVEFSGDGSINDYVIRTIKVNYDESCDSEQFVLLAESLTSRMLFMLGVPAALFLAFMFIGPQIWDINVRRLLGLLLDGYRPEFYWWEGVSVLRTNLMYMTISWGAGSPRVQLTYMFVIVTVFLILQLTCNPYDSRSYDVLNRFETLIIFSNVVIVVYGLAHVLEFPFESILLIIGFIANIAVLFYGALAVFRTTYSLRIQILIEYGCYVSPATYLVHQFVRLFMGINPAYYEVTEDGRYILNVSQLYERERKFLVEALGQTLSACLDCSKNFHLWLLERSIHEGLQRALNARSEFLRHYYYDKGTRPHAMFTPLRLLEVTLRPLDVPPKPREVPRRRTTLGDVPYIFKRLFVSMVKGASFQEVSASASFEPVRKQEAADERARRAAERGPNAGEAAGRERERSQPVDQRDNCITIEELYDALQGVCVDILERHPRIHTPQRPAVRDEKEITPDAECKRTSSASSISETTVSRHRTPSSARRGSIEPVHVWTMGATFSDIDCTVDRVEVLVDAEGTQENPLLDALQEEATTELKAANDFMDAECCALEDRLASLQEQIRIQQEDLGMRKRTWTTSSERSSPSRTFSPGAGVGIAGL